MATNSWLRLWHDMPNDPKWRTVARVSKQPISMVISVFVHLMVDASRNVTRGHASVTPEDLASALDCEEQQIEAILFAMQGRVLDGMRLCGWDVRQPKREDSGDPERGVMSAAERKRAQRQREKDAIKNAPAESDVTTRDDGAQAVSHAASREVTLDTDTDKSISPSLRSGESARARRAPQPRPKSEAKTLATYLSDCRASGVRPVPDGHSVRQWAADAGITPEMLQIAWVKFRERYTEDEKGKGKRYRDWPRHFARAVKDNWFRLWFVDERGMGWTTQGLTQKTVLDKRMTRQEEVHEPA